MTGTVPKKTFYAALVLIPLAFSRMQQADAADNCQLGRYAQLDLGTDLTGGVTITMAVNGTSEKLLIDTGGIFSMLTDATVKKLGLGTRYIRGGIWLQMYGGVKLDRYAAVDTIQLGQLTRRDFHFLIMPDGRAGLEAVGTLAPDILSAYDVEFDFKNEKFGLFSQDHCPDQVVYWTQAPYARVPLHLNRYGQMTIPVMLDGKKLEAMLDTGSTVSFFSLESTRELFDWKSDPSALKPIDPSNPRSFKYPFKTLTFDGIAVNNPDVILVPDDVSNLPGRDSDRLILGMDILRQLHIYIAYGEGYLYATSADAQ